jgi:hypothetical protein
MFKLEVSLTPFGFPAHFTYESPNILPHVDPAAMVNSCTLPLPPPGQSMPQLESTSKSEGDSVELGLELDEEVEVEVEWTR